MTNYFLGEDWGVQINIYKKQTYYLFTYSVLLLDSRTKFIIIVGFLFIMPT